MPAAPTPGRPRPGTFLRSVTFLHTADWQLGKAFASIDDHGKRARLQQERFEAVRRLAAVVHDRQARFVVVAGDLFDSPTPTHATISAALAAIAAIGVPVLAIPGNHDHGGPDSLWEQPFFKRERERLAPQFQLLSRREPTFLGLGDRGDGPDEVILLPCPLLRRHEPDDPTAWIRDIDFDELGAGRDGDPPRIVIAHGSTTSFLAGGSGRDDEDGDHGRVAAAANTIAIERLPIDELDYIALGDWHGFANVGPKAWQAGTPEIDRFRKPGQEPGHVAVVTVSRGEPPAVAAIPTGRFRWISHECALDASLDGADAASDRGEARGPTALDDWLLEETKPQSPGQPGFDGCLAKLSLSGTVSLAGRAELDRILESWQARLLRLDVDDAVRIAPTLDEIHDLAHRPSDPIISRVAAELIRRLEAGTATGDSAAAELDVIRRAIFMLHALAHPALAHPALADAAANTTPGDLAP